MLSDKPLYIRVAITKITDSHLIVRNEEIGRFRVPVVPNSGYDLTYLLPYMKVGTQLNLVQPKQLNDDEYTAKLVIAEPDYLYDITGVAECFESYGNSPKISLLKRIKPETVTRHILLGGFAGLLLDEAVRGDGKIKLTYNDLATNFFRSNAVRIAVCDDIDAKFHENVKRQQANIEKAVSVSLRNLPEYDAEKVILEPSFFCEMLGLQGRMDLLQTDFSVLVEQKSGKGDFGSSEHGKPVHRVPHLVQLILYQAVLHYGFNVPETDINFYLLYSKYPEPLLRERVVESLLQAAIRMRNLLVCQELEIAFGDGLNNLTKLTPESFRTAQVHLNFWDSYVKPDLERALTPLLTADSLSLEYALRLFKFVATEQYYSKVGYNGNGASDGFAGAWKASVDEKINAGNIIHGLKILSTITDESEAITGLTLTKPDDDAGEMPNFRVGDIVVLYPYGRSMVPDLRNGIVIRCSISAICDNTITVTLRAPQTNKSFFTNRSSQRWAMEHDVMDSSFRALWRNINMMLATPQSRRELILGTRAPEVDETMELNGDYGDFNPLVKSAKQAKELYIIIGPPGTGKTSHGLMNILAEELSDPESSVLLGAYTIRAVDEICAKLTEKGIDFIRVGTSLGCSELYANNMIGARVSQCQNIQQVKELLRETRVIVGTTQSITANIPLFNLRGFSLAIIDEASQILEPQLIGLLSAMHGESPAIKKFVLIGDHKQLPAVVKQSVAESTVESELLNGIKFTDCRRSFFERQLDLIRERCEGHTAEKYLFTLSNQGRMHTDVAHIASSFFYDGNLGTVPLPHQTTPIEQVDTEGVFGDALNRSRNIFVNVRVESPVTNDNSNRLEAKAIGEIILSIFQRERGRFNPGKTVGVIVPYRNQIAAIKKEIAAFGITELSDISIDTVERFQGSQRDYIVYGFTIKRPDQFAFLTSTRFEENGIVIDRKLNVALTRAKSHNILVGDTKLLCRDPLYNRLIDCFLLEGMVISYDTCPGLPPSASLPELPALDSQSE